MVGWPESAACGRRHHTDRARWRVDRRAVAQDHSKPWRLDAVVEQTVSVARRGRSPRSSSSTSGRRTEMLDHPPRVRVAAGRRRRSSPSRRGRVVPAPAASAGAELVVLGLPCSARRSASTIWSLSTPSWASTSTRPLPSSMIERARCASGVATTNGTDSRRRRRAGQATGSGCSRGSRYRSDPSPHPAERRSKATSLMRSLICSLKVSRIASLRVSSAAPCGCRTGGP